MAGRVFAFADPRIIKLLQTEFIPVCTDDWYTRRRTDDTGKFFRSMSDQTSRKASGNTNTRQGIYAFTADGEALTFKNAGQDVQATLNQIEEALRKWNKLPANRRDPGVLTIPAHGPLDARFARPLPQNGLILKVQARILDREGEQLSVGSSDFLGGDRASRDFAWFTEQEVSRLLPKNAAVGQKYTLDEAISRRICRFHLVDNTRGEPPFWTKKELRKSNFALTVLKVTPERVTVKLEGEAELASEADYTKAERGYIVRLGGQFEYDPRSKRIGLFELSALGEHWGCGAHTAKGVRPGRGLLGITFTQVDPATPANRVSPQAIREIGLYYGRYEE